MVERLCLDNLQSFGQYDALHSAVRKGAAANVDDIAAKIKRGQINIGIITEIFDDRDIAACQLGILPIPLGTHIGNTQIVSASTVIPVLCQMRRQSFCGEVDVEILCT